jgi:hypothetical protein
MLAPHPPQERIFAAPPTPEVDISIILLSINRSSQRPPIAPRHPPPCTSALNMAIGTPVALRLGTIGGAPMTRQIRSALETLAPELTALAQADVAPPPIPAERFIAEARALALVADKDGAALTRVGVDRKLIAALPVRADALAAAQAQLDAVRGRARSRDEVKTEKTALEARGDFMASARYALRGDPEGLSVLDRIAQGEGVDDLVQDLRALAELARSREPAFKAVGFDVRNESANALGLAASLEILVAKRRAGTRDEADAMDLRNRAATLLAIAVIEVRTAGTYIFRKDARRLRKYQSEYNNIRRARNRSRTPGPSTPTPPPVV